MKQLSSSSRNYATESTVRRLLTVQLVEVFVFWIVCDSFMDSGDLCAVPDVKGCHRCRELRQTPEFCIFHRGLETPSIFSLPRSKQDLFIRGEYLIWLMIQWKFYFQRVIAKSGLMAYGLVALWPCGLMSMCSKSMPLSPRPLKLGCQLRISAADYL